MKKYAVLAMDLEDWFHLDYFLDSNCDKSQSTLDGFSIFLQVFQILQQKDLGIVDVII